MTTNHHYNNHLDTGAATDPAGHSPRLFPRAKRSPEHIPLISQKPPLANPEIDDIDPDDSAPVAPQPGVDDGFFTTDSQDDPDPDVEAFTPPVVERHDDGTSTDDIPVIVADRAGDEGDELDGKKPPSDKSGGGLQPRFPGYAPGFGHDLEGGTGSVFPGDLDSIPDVNVYQHKKTLAQGMMDLALFSANANQLRYVLETFSNHPYYYPSLVLLSISLILQVAIGIGLIWNATYNVKDEKEICIANKISNFTIIGIFLVTVVNVFISAFGVAPAGPGSIVLTASLPATGGS